MWLRIIHFLGLTNLSDEQVQTFEINSKVVFARWLTKYKRKIIPITVVTVATILFNLFLYHGVIAPTATAKILEAETKFLEAEAKFLKETATVKAYYEDKINKLTYKIKVKEETLYKLRSNLEELRSSREEIILLKQEVALKESQIKVYKQQIVFLEDELEKTRKLLETLMKTKIFTDKSKIDTVDTTEPIILRNQPNQLIEDEVKSMLKNHGFFSQQYDWNKEFCNPNGKGLDNDFVLQKNGQIVYDRASGLMWQQSGSDDDMSFEEAMRWVEQLTFAGFDDWRLPTLEEAMSLVEPEQKNDDLYIDPVFNSKQSWIWTLDLVKDESWAAWVVYFLNGSCYRRSVDSTSYVRAVRSVVGDLKY